MALSPSPILPRYKTGDLIRVFKLPYFHCIGRKKWWMPLQYAWDEFRPFNLGGL
jgi:hypothetical protein